VPVNKGEYKKVPRFVEVIIWVLLLVQAVFWFGRELATQNITYSEAVELVESDSVSEAMFSGNVVTLTTIRGLFPRPLHETSIPLYSTAIEESLIAHDVKYDASWTGWFGRNGEWVLLCLGGLLFLMRSKFRLPVKRAVTDFFTGAANEHPPLKIV
jgi:hypothetical protein